jgi:hypothetical protein
MPMNPRLLRPRATGFNPKTIAGLSVWLDAADSTTITLNATTVSEWRDKSGNARNYAQATAANQPTTGTVNGRNSVRAEAGSTRRQLTTTGFSLSAYTVFAVVVPDFSSNPAGFSSFTGIMAIGTGASGMMMLGRVGSPTRWGTFASSSVSSNTQLVTGARYILVLQDANDNAISFFRNGAADGTSTGNSAGQTTNHLFGLFDGQEFHGDICEVLVYSSVLAASARSQVDRYLAGKWGVTLS